jgi:hypothetical protein
MKKIVLCVICVILVLGICAIIGCVKSASDINNVGMQAAGPIDYGNGVYYFASNRADFGNALSAFIRAHQDLEVASMASDDTGIEGFTSGYFVVFKRKG